MVYLQWQVCFVHYQKGCSLQHGLGTQDSDRIRNPTWSFGDFGPDRAPGHVLCAILTYVLVC